MLGTMLSPHSLQDCCELAIIVPIIAEKMVGQEAITASNISTSQQDTEPTEVCPLHLAYSAEIQFLLAILRGVLWENSLTKG